MTGRACPAPCGLRETPEGFSLRCPCGRRITVEVRGQVRRGRLAQFAVTCDGCGAAHWLTVAADGEAS